MICLASIFKLASCWTLHILLLCNHLLKIILKFNFKVMDLTQICASAVYVQSLCVECDLHFLISTVDLVPDTSYHDDHLCQF